jgi:hypothetical protein
MFYLPIEKQGSKDARKQESKEARKEANLPMSSSRGSLRSSTGTFRSKAICAGVLFVLQSGQAYKYTDPIVVQAENKERHQKLPAKTRARKHPPSKNRENKERQIVQRAPHRKCERERQKS